MVSQNGLTPDEMFNRLMENFRVLAGEVSALRTDMDQGFKAVNVQLDAVNTRLDNVERVVQDLRGDVQELQAAVGQLSEGVPV